VTPFVERDDLLSWGRTLRARHHVARPHFLDEASSLLESGKRFGEGLLAIGLRRSYGDSGLNADGAVIDMTGLDRFAAFDRETGVLVAEAGVSLDQILRLAVPQGFFLPVTPGTRHVTLGGAVANDVHGENHHSAGTFGRWVKSIELLRSDGSRQTLTPDDESGLFAATIGGLGLTGLIARVSLQLQPIRSAELDVSTVAFEHVGEFFALARESADRHAYTVAWIDVMAQGERLGRGLFTKADHSETGPRDVTPRRARLNIPFDMPGRLLNRWSLRGFNALYHARGKRKRDRARVPYDRFFFPLDAIGGWNRLYGRRGLYQYQCVVPVDAAEDATAGMLDEIAQAGEGSCLVVLKTFGALPSPGMLSFPMEGTTLALDFPNRGPSTLRLLERLDAIVRDAGGRLYPAKDGRLPPTMFREGYPNLENFSRHVDPAFSSSFWRRMHGAGSA
jgi:FAD/FMN-containing dehydrogenase